MTKIFISLTACQELIFKRIRLYVAIYKSVLLFYVYIFDRHFYPKQLTLISLVDRGPCQSTPSGGGTFHAGVSRYKPRSPTWKVAILPLHCPVRSFTQSPYTSNRFCLFLSIRCSQLHMAAFSIRGWEVGCVHKHLTTTAHTLLELVKPSKLSPHSQLSAKLSCSVPPQDGNME